MTQYCTLGFLLSNNLNCNFIESWNGSIKLQFKLLDII